MAAVVALLALLYLAVFIIVKGAQDKIIAQNHVLQKDQQALALSEECWKFALEGAGDGVWDRDLQTGEVVFSKRFLEIHGFAAHELEHQAESWQARIHPDDLARVEADRLANFQGTNRPMPTSGACKPGMAAGNGFFRAAWWSAATHKASHCA